ncbi:competence protein ComJ [Pseudomonas sp. DTU_2021_1001937_2_SI_NGA_ILE_001]|uniref:competence protein ComJ n=1 Tax=Pseudomonas sp. DTU_2021_1001937_2_SI_NGA_ILE_001 TaxID=3077589 RepID=UPI0028FC273D|nr:competence protein ComJ [Pseudomonas sp. DTU_2021_1001937_2_SI_NGA_ILE_001]WNW10067.1 competence protein ComJ [Pseudomonas sp. DTU_2021_1001937_2_SI_NGA_ILE_001]
MNENKQTIDLLISHSQILVRGRDYSEEDSQWGPLNIRQGAIIHDDYVIFDPLPDDTFGAHVELAVCEAFAQDSRAQRCIAVSFRVADSTRVEVASATESKRLNIGLKEMHYALYFEVCEGDEVFYKFTFVPSDAHQEPRYVIDDPWGGTQGAALVKGIA